MRKGILILSSAALIGLTASCGGGGQKVKDLKAEVDSLEQRIQFVTDSLSNSWQSKMDSAVAATKRQVRAAMSSSGSSNQSQDQKREKSDKSKKFGGDQKKMDKAEKKKKKFGGDGGNGGNKSKKDKFGGG